MWFSRSKKEGSISHSILIDTSNSTLIAISAYMPALRFLNEEIMDTFIMRNVPEENARRILVGGPRSYPEWSYGGVNPSFSRTNPKTVTEALRERAYLSSQKALAVKLVTEWINRRRDEKVENGLFFQESIYAVKERQARLFERSGFEESLLSEVPYVVLDADRRGIPLKQAAEEILLQATLDRDYLARTERMRLELFDKLRAAKTPRDISDVIEITQHYTL